MKVALSEVGARSYPDLIALYQLKETKISTNFLMTFFKLLFFFFYQESVVPSDSKVEVLYN